MNDGRQSRIDESTNSYDERIRENYRRNYCSGIAQGLFFYGGMGLYNSSSVFTKLIFDLSHSNQVIGLMGAGMSIAYTLSQLIGIGVLAGLQLKKPLVLRYGFFYRLSWLLMGLTLVLLPPGQALVLIIALRAAGDFGNGIYKLAFFDFMARIIPLDKRGEYFGRRNSLGQVAQAAAGGLAGIVVGRFSYYGGTEYRAPTGYAICLFLAFLIHMVDLWLLSRLKEEPLVVTRANVSLSATVQAIFRLLRADRNFARYAILRAFMEMGYMTAPFFIVYASQRMAMTGPQLGVFTTVNLLAWASGTFIWGSFADRWGFKRIMETSTVLLALVFFASPLLKDFAAFILFFTVSGFIVGGQMLSFNALLMEFGRPHNRPTYIATQTVIAGVAGMLGPMLSGFLADRFSYVFLFILVGILMLVTDLVTRLKVTDPRQVLEHWL